jgi:hypothetical protein
VSSEGVFFSCRRDSMPSLETPLRKSHSMAVATATDQTVWPDAIFSSSAILSSIGGWVS